MITKNYEAELHSRVAKAIRPHAKDIKALVTEDTSLRHRAHTFNAEAAEDLYESLRGAVVTSGGSAESLAEFMRWGAHDQRVTKAIYSNISDLLSNAREEAARLFHPQAVEAAKAALAAVDAVGAEAQKQWDKLCADSGEPQSVCRFTRERCAELSSALRSIIRDDGAWGPGVLAEFCD